ncbi:N-acetylmuramoyl-L-alanine amidase [Ferrovibrio terrae]|uniref:N-acetylmuramoyl-L-alanine amidase n=1 Tax=Ferrovibrio terrae TaxID=2594003 RepID=A0A516GYR4_9PROT|nr:N-acetylmuramoyl-L-alanine amidase [Ferrovibrio terrae]QDO96674.1 N-acetylmuramoyl-L-alanine amidase [Ferrovibrio terrae]
MYTRRFIISSLVGLLGSAAVPSWADAAARKSPPLPGRKPTPNAPKMPPRAPAVVILDPGHGGRDPGAIGVTGTEEKDVTLSVCQSIRQALAGRSDIKVFLTRDRDTYIPLPSRVAFAHEKHADLFISIHADAAPNRSARGLSAYTRAEKATDDFARRLADRENQVDAIYGFDAGATDKQTAAILIDLARRHGHNASLSAKKRIVTGVGHRVQLLENPMRAANFAVLRSPALPSVLIETGFLSNPQDEKILRNAKSRADLARYLADQIAPVAMDLREA